MVNVGSQFFEEEQERALDGPKRGVKYSQDRYRRCYILLGVGSEVFVRCFCTSSNRHESVHGRRMALPHDRHGKGKAKSHKHEDIVGL